MVDIAFAPEISPELRHLVLEAAHDWEEATDEAIRFRLLDDHEVSRRALRTRARPCPSDHYVVVRWPHDNENRYFAWTGYRIDFAEQGRPQVLALDEAEELPPYSTIVHELGHVIGLEHEHERPDRDRWIRYFLAPDVARPYASTSRLYHLRRGEPSRSGHAPLLEQYHVNVPYSYSSVMHYEGFLWDPVPAYLCSPMRGYAGGASAPSHEDVSRLEQLYFRAKFPGTSLLQSLDTDPNDPGAPTSAHLDNFEVHGQLPAAGLRGATRPLGTPAVVLPTADLVQVFVRGSDSALYATSIPLGQVAGRITPRLWTRVTSNLASDPCAVATDDGQVDLCFLAAAPGEQTLRMTHARMSGDRVVFIRPVGDGRLPAGSRSWQLPGADPRFDGPAIACRSRDSIDVIFADAPSPLRSRLFHARFDRRWSQWSEVPHANVVGRVGVLGVTEERLLIVGRGADSMLKSSWHDGSWSKEWEFLGQRSRPQTPPAIVAIGRRPHVLVSTLGAQKLGVYERGTGWRYPGGALHVATGPAAASRDAAWRPHAAPSAAVVVTLGAPRGEGMDQTAPPGLWIRWLDMTPGC